MKWNIEKVRSGESEELLKQGYEPFGVVSHDTSYLYQNTTNNQRELHRQATDYIYLRKHVKQ